jgi:Ca2+-binding EF-hand superfamily protein
MRTILTRSLLVAVVISIALGTALGQSRRRRSRSDDRSTSADDSSGSSGRLARTESFLRMLDANHNGLIEADEVPASQKPMVEGIFRRAGIEAKYPVSVSRVLEGMTDGGGRGQNESPNGGGQSKSGPNDPKPPSAVPGFGPPTGDGSKPPGSPGPSPPTGPSASSPENKSKSGETSPSSEPKTSDSKASASAASPVRGSGRFRTPKERLPDGLPEWFRRRDVDGDGQVTMAEFAQEWTPDKLAEFNRYDLNHDGIITAAECLKAEKRPGRSSR